MSAEELYSIKMRASKKENGTDVHISGAEKIVEAPDVDIFANALIERGMHHSKGEADALNLKINKVCKENIIYLDALSVETIEVETWEKGQEEIKKYLKETKKNCPYALRKHLDAELKTSLIEFCETQDNPTMGTIEKRFGNPKQYAAEYLSLCEANDIDKRINHSKKIKLTLLIATLVLIIAAILTVVFVVQWNKKNHPTYVYTDVIDEENGNEKLN